jgi:5'-deoxynucleotidase YfbR-like HD superfamily hydrolase
MPSRRILDELYKLKQVKRRGWASRGMLNAESVPDHIFGAMLLAEMFLPETAGGDETVPANYNKNEILRMLLIHDLAEAFTGDKLPLERSPDEEAEYFRYIAMSGTYRVFPGLSQTFDRWQAFEYTDNINAQIARDVDKIENLVQLYIYSRVDALHIEDFEKWERDLTESVKTALGKGMVATVRNLFEKPKMN